MPGEIIGNPGQNWVLSERHTVVVGTPLVLFPAKSSFSLSVAPLTGGSILVEISISPPGVADELMIWHALDSNVTTSMFYAFPSPVSAIRVTATTADCIVELAA